MFSDPWLERWMPLVIERSPQTPVLEMGCGYGDDTVTLTRAGLNVMAMDLSPLCVTAAKLRTPSAKIMCMDLREDFPKDWPQFGVVIASLSLHYFSWMQTEAIVKKIWSSLAPGGIFLCRLNSTEDVNFGAQRGLEIEENFYVVNGQDKRFFDRSALDKLCGSHWNWLCCEQKTSMKYSKPKVLWELILEKPIPDTASG